MIRQPREVVLAMIVAALVVGKRRRARAAGVRVSEWSVVGLGRSFRRRRSRRRGSGATRSLQRTRRHRRHDGAPELLTLASASFGAGELQRRRTSKKRRTARVASGPPIST